MSYLSYPVCAHIITAFSGGTPPRRAFSPPRPLLPVLMGAIVEIVGLENSFYAVGGLILLVLVWLAVRAPRAAPVGESG